MSKKKQKKEMYDAIAKYRRFSLLQVLLAIGLCFIAAGAGFLIGEMCDGQCTEVAECISGSVIVVILCMVLAACVIGAILMICVPPHEMFKDDFKD